MFIYCPGLPGRSADVWPDPSLPEPSTVYPGPGHTGLILWCSSASMCGGGQGQDQHHQGDQGWGWWWVLTDNIANSDDHHFLRWGYQGAEVTSFLL